MMHAAWTDDAIALLRELYPHNPTSAVAAILDRSIRATYDKARQLGIKKTAA